LHASEFVESDKSAGYYHPAFRELCESRIYRNHIEKILENLNYFKNQEVIFAVNNKCISKAIGQKKCNINYFKNKFFVNIKIKPDENLGLFEVRLLNC
ncbi:MAG: radical SAM protein, partial [Oscillospiraceae bacterium]|nr:radical SAM protein [Oscillospiraceae bacterium]